ncbi:DUF2335 domain-containing protein [Thiomicrospira sp. R3]|uniref:DUF2335 domain-containing protein n=1 Tax=Thiomicrospira sp. R3 TaxID=3035472 RepID=UPI00259B0382|nr:DUF2335 domain-containing protein [Thiomicrospira sp. R3]WFE68803.1 DUF2335 domain-containing protein [Thiomicrospira sp. R3]
MNEQSLTAAQAQQQEQIVELVAKLEQGCLTQLQQSQLALLLKNAPSEFVLTATHHQSFSAPIPPPEQLKQYPEDARKLILDMAHKEQSHAHFMNEKALTGAIQKDRLGQYVGGSIAIIGLVAAAWIAQYSAVAAGIIATLDLFGMVALFVAPRLLENRKTGENI